MESTDLETVEAMRAFNRFYTNRLGVLGQGYLGSGYNLTEARILYEIGARRSVAAVALIRELQLDAAYLSRIIKRFRAAGLIETTPDPQDKRSQIITPTDHGIKEFEKLGAASRVELAAMVDNLGQSDRERLKAAFSTIRLLLDPSASRNEPAVLRPHRPGDLGWIVQSQAEFYTAAFGWNSRFEALVAEIAGKFLANFDPAREFCWIAERGGTRVGSALIMDGGEGIAKLRLLYVDEQARGLGLGRLLVEECIRFSRASGYRKLTLWTNDILHAARHIYVKAGFVLEAEEPHTLFGPQENGQTWTLTL
ncbi:helix-turn-helix domain-containing GNAT family N-acetyltransferase [Rhizobium sp. RU36D]|uniref:bifunctional helix-turn-helix transcriptional regulator/GNAT family N-acetyltransferase n=1 Tax=Rhizobium sp. RU36D TaxID=1907415 RepID=UPI0009D89988|nr:helix-turn-helix domain-containing GNAT family N-acetyltransferase [Rhizobium sp. RU36D]SMC56861.1 transcriptional regulator, MarR family with acetyltransferase activity [Rhizobium sp. RU36D]